MGVNFERLLLMNSQRQKFRAAIFICIVFELNIKYNNFLQPLYYLHIVHNIDVYASSMVHS